MEKKKVFYTSIALEGFQSVGTTLIFDLDRIGINLIRGENGKGKSTIFNALLWLEYGINLKKSVATWEDKRPSTFRGTRVVAYRTDGVYDYMIARHLSFKGTTRGLQGGDKLMIFKKEKSEETFTQAHLQGDGLHKVDMQEMIEWQLGIDATTYMNSIFFGQRMKSLAEVDNKEKRGLFDKLFDVAFVEDAKKNADTKKVEISTDLFKAESSVAESKRVVENTQLHIEDQQKLVDTFEGKKKGRLAELVNELEQEDKELATIPNTRKEYQDKLAEFDFDKLIEAEKVVQKSKDELSSAQDIQHTKSRSIKEAADEILRSKNKQVKLQQDLDAIAENCPTCSTPLNKTEITKAKATVKKAIKLEEEVHTTLSKARELQLAEADKQTAVVEELTAKYKSTQEALQAIREGLKAADNYKYQLNILEAKESSLTISTAKIKEEIARVEKDTLEIDFDKLETTVELHQKIIAETTVVVAQLKDTLSKVEWWCSKGFGARGLKAFVFNAMLDGLNQYARKYAQRLGFRVEFTVDMTKATKPFQMLVYSGDKVRDYEDLSGGQKQRVDVCIAFAMHDLVSFKTDINIVLLDEVFEGLDNAGVEAAFDLIRQKAENKSVYVITHSDIIDSLNCKTITVNADEKGNTFVQ